MAKRTTNRSLSVFSKVELWLKIVSFEKEASTIPSAAILKIAEPIY